MQHAIKYLNTYFGWKTTKSLYDKNLDSYSVTFKITSTQSKSFEEFLLEFFSPFLKGSQEIRDPGGAVLHQGGARGGFKLAKKSKLFMNQKEKNFVNSMILCVIIEGVDS